MAHQWIPVHNAGAEVMLHGMLRALADRGHEVDVTLSRQMHDVSYRLDGVHVWPGRDPRTLLADADVIVAHLENTPAASLLGRWNHIPVVHVLHNTMQVTKDWAVSGSPSLLVANSEWMLADYTAALGDAMPKAIVCRPPVQASAYATTPGDRLTLINLRRMEQSPGGAVMGKGSEVFWALAERMPDVGFLGVCGAYGGQDLRSLPNVEIVDHVPHHAMRDIVYARTRVLLMPSNYESWGRTAVEAYASGIPVVAHPTPGLVEACNGAGIFCDRDDLDAWETALRRLAWPDVYAASSAAARARSAALDPTEDLNRWCDAVEALAA
jgi:hypothetical protein